MQQARVRGGTVRDRLLSTSGGPQLQLASGAAERIKWRGE
jgi:hypothetical protein